MKITPELYRKFKAASDKYGFCLDLLTDEGRRPALVHECETLVSRFKAYGNIQ